MATAPSVTMLPLQQCRSLCICDYLYLIFGNVYSILNRTELQHFKITDVGSSRIKGFSIRL